VVNDEANQPDGLTEAERELQLEVVYPAKLSGEQVHATLSQLVAARTKRHQNLAYGSTAMLPVSLAMGLLPGTDTHTTQSVVRVLACCGTGRSEHVCSKAYSLCVCVVCVVCVVFDACCAGPNVFLAWNVYRLYSHVQALRGGKLFLDLSSRNRVSYSPSHELEEIIRTEVRCPPPSQSWGGCVRNLQNG
jgi:hypothetical protein